jgi:hypothetical protein
VPLTDEQKRERRRKRIANVFALESLLICATFWMLLAAQRGNLTGLQWLGLMGIAVASAVLAAILRSRLWTVALPASIAMFFFVMYVMGT